MISVVQPVPPGSTSTCGYCSPNGERSNQESSVTQTSLVAIQLSCDVYQRMINRGWRRSGTYAYKPDMRKTCCPQYTIKLDVAGFTPSKSQRKLLNRFNNFVTQKDADSMDVDGEPKVKSKAKKGKGRAPPSSLVKAIHASEVSFKSDPEVEYAQQFEMTLEPSSYTLEKFELYCKYQQCIHLDKENKPSGFKRFLVDSPLARERIPYHSTRPDHLPENYGSHHQMYRLNGELIAMGVLDILPACVSSVYFMYDQKYEKHSLGKISALREASLVREMHDAGAPGMDSLYMGYYIHSCPKMKYKGEYSPSFLADPVTYEWYHLEECVKLLEVHRYACFSQPESSMTAIPEDEGTLEDLASSILTDIHLIKNVNNGRLTVVPANLSNQWKDPETKETLQACFVGLGVDLAKDIVFDC